MKRLIVFLFLINVLSSCTDNTFREDKMFAGGVYVKAETLNLGKQIYTEYCMACHGVNGDGKGVASKAMKVPPRNFKTGVIKFGRVLSGELVHDDTVVKILQKGLNGTAMLPWDITDKQAYAVVQYIKTFAPEVWEGKDKKLGKKITPTRDPYGDAHKLSAIQRGKEVYHIVANCQSCHRAYATKDEISAMSKKIDGEAITEFEDDLYLAKAQVYDWGTQVLPPDFTFHSLRSVKTVEDLYIRLAAGVGGGVMPAWKDVISDSDIWAVSHYVKSLMDLKGDKASKDALFTKLNIQ